MSREAEENPGKKNPTSTEERLRAVNQQLRASEQQLKAVTQQLRASNQQLRAGEEQLRMANYKLGVRVKELDCLYALSQLIGQREISLEEIFGGAIDLICSGWQYPEVTCARVTFEGQEFKSENFKLTKPVQSADIKIHQKKAGTIEVCYLEKKPKADEGPFLIEERKLIETLAEELGEVIEHKRAEQGRAEEHNLLRTLMDNLPDCIYIKDTKSRFIMGNAELASSVGVTTPDELVGKTDFDFYPRELASKYYADEQEVVRLGQALIDREEQVVHQTTGHTVWNLTAKVPWRDSSGNIVGILGMSRDITERKLAEEKLKAVNQQLMATEQQLRAANQQLRADEQQLKSINQQLRAAEQQLKAANQQLIASEQQLRAANQQLRTTEVIYQTAIENARSVPYQFSWPDGKYIFTGSGFKELVGIAAEELTSKRFHNLIEDSILISPEGFDSMEAYGQAFMRGDMGRYQADIRIRMPQGRLKWLSDCSIPIRNGETGKVVSVIGILTDITERKEVEQTLQKQKEELQIILDSVTAAILYKDTNNRYVRVNKAAAESLGMAAEDIVGKTTHEIFPDEAEHFCEDDLEIMRTGRPKLGLIEHLRWKPGDKEKRWFQTNKVSYHDEKGNIAGIIVFSVDITDAKQTRDALEKANVELERRVEERTARLLEINKKLETEIAEHKRAEEALRESQRQQKALLDAIPDMAWLKDKESRFIAVNKLFGQRFGLSPDELVGKTDLDIWPKELAEKYLADDRELIETGQRKRVEEELKNEKGQRISVETIKTPIYDGDGQIVGTSGIARDISERKQMEKMLRETEKLAAAGRLAARIAHEINNPLAGIKNSFMLIKDAIPQDHKYYEYVGRIDKEILRVSDIVRQMFDLYRPVSKSPNKFNLSKVINDIAALVKVSCKEHNVGIETDINDDSVAVTLVEGLFRQVLFNIIQNAIEASEAGETVKVSAEVSDGLLIVKVADGGLGIDEKIRDNIFEPFFTTKDGFATSGLGLGLSVCKSSVDAMGGTIEVKSKKGKGTTFTVTIRLRNG